MLFLRVGFLIENPTESWKTARALGMSGCFVIGSLSVAGHGVSLFILIVGCCSMLAPGNS